MYAIIKSGGRQVKVVPGSVIEVDRVDFNPGDEVTITDVFLVAKDSGEVAAGAPFVANARVLGVIEGESRGPKIRVFRKKRRKGYRRTRGFRATMTKVRIKGIEA